VLPGTSIGGAGRAAVHAALSEEGSREELLQEALRAALAEAGLAQGGIYIFESSTKKLTLAAHQGAGPELVARFGDRPWQETYAAHILDRQQTLVVDDLLEDEVLARLPRHPLHASGFRSLAAQPLRRGGELLGMIFAVSREPRGISRAAVAALTDLAEPLTLALEKHRLQAEVLAARAELRALRTRLTWAGRVEALGRLRGGMVHDLNNLLSVVLSFSELGLEDLGPEVDLRESLREIRRAADRASALTRKLLGIDRPRAPGRFRTEPVALIQELARMLARLAGEGIELRVQAEEPVGEVLIDPDELELALANLVVNSRDAMPLGGLLTLEVGARCFEAEELRGWPRARPGEFAVITVRDTGEGMTPEVRARAFEPYFTTKAPDKGSGLGLATVRETLERAGGLVELGSAPGRGTEVRLGLPLAGGPAPARERRPAARPALPRPADLRPARVLVVDDEPAVRQVARSVLERAGLRVLEAADGQEALELLGADPGACDLVLTDIAMPRLSGPALARALRVCRPDARVVFMTGQLLPAGPADGLLAGLGPDEHILAKPFDVGALLAAVRAGLGDR